MDYTGARHWYCERNPFRDKGFEVDLFRTRIPGHRTLALKSQVRPKNGFLDILAKRNSKLGGALPYQSSSLAREFYLHPDFSGARSTTGTLLSRFLHSTRSLANALHARNNVCTQLI